MPGHHRGIADLDGLRERNPHVGPVIDQMVLMRDSLNTALAQEGQHIAGDAPHAPLYFDYLDSDRSNCKAFSDGHHSFIGMTVPRFVDMVAMAQRLADDAAVVSNLDVPHETNREHLQGLLLWIAVPFAISHEYTHHTHAHLLTRPGGIGRLRQQACELDADGWAVYLSLNAYVLGDGRAALASLLDLKETPEFAQEAVGCLCILAMHAAITFSGVRGSIDYAKIYWDTHPLPSLRLHLLLRHAQQFFAGFRPELGDYLSPARYQGLMDAVSALAWQDSTAPAEWNVQREWLRTAAGMAYGDALVAALEDIRAMLRKWEGDATGLGDTSPLE